MKGRRSGFTLLELLVVIAILAVLSATTAVAIFRILRDSREKMERSTWRTARSLGESSRRTIPLRILFIGNSYTSVNDLPGMVKALADGSGTRPELIIEQHTVGGATLEQHWNEGEAVRKIRSAKWDLVVLQEQSVRPIIERAIMHEYARKFDQVIREREAIPLFYLTWARRTFPDSQKQLTSAYMKIAEEVRGEVAPVGVAWERALRQNPSRQLHAADDSHPTELGTYLAACVFHAAIHDQSPVGLPATIQAGGSTVRIAPDEARALQEIAWKVHQETKRTLLGKRGLVVARSAASGVFNQRGLPGRSGLPCCGREGAGLG